MRIAPPERLEPRRSGGALAPRRRSRTQRIAERLLPAALRSRRQRIAERLLSAALLIVAAACAEGGDRPATTVTDSAGIAIVTNAPLADLARYETDPEPLVGIGLLEGDPSLLLHRVTGGLVLDDGGVVVLNAGSSEVRWYDSAGRFLRSQGRAGQGPGEYGSPNRLFRYRGDSLAVWDGPQRRLTILDPDGGYARDLTPSGDLEGPAVLGAFGDGALAVFDQRLDARETDEYQDMPGRTVRYDPTGAPTGDTLAANRWLTARYVAGEGFVQLHGRAMERPPVRAVAADGLWVGDPRSGELRRYAPDGSGLTHIVRWPLGDRTVTDAMEAAYTHEQLAAAPNEEVRQAILRGADQREYVEVLPAFEALGVAADGRLWLEAFRPPGAPEANTWWVFDGEGRALHAVALPAGAEPLWSEGERVLLKLRDELDVERVELRALRPVDGSTR